MFKRLTRSSAGLQLSSNSTGSRILHEDRRVTAEEQVGQFLYDFLSYIAIGAAVFGIIAVSWIWRLYYSKDNPPPRSRLLMTLAVKNTLVMLCSVIIAALAVYRLAGGPPLWFSGALLVVVLILLEAVNGITVTYLWSLRRSRRRLRGRASPPPFEGGE
jgi:heme/copper-type cytochrome/quinol oxidase subunit 3